MDNFAVSEIMGSIEVDERLRYHEFVKTGQVIPQGDVNLHAVPDFSEQSLNDLAAKLSATWKTTVKLAGPGKKASSLQVVSGDTMGSRHCVSADTSAVVEMFEPAQGAHPLQGNMIRANGRYNLVHPEHGPHSIPEGHFVVIRQRDFATEQMRAIAD